MTRPENLDWLADEEGNLRPEAARVLEGRPVPVPVPQSEPARPVPPGAGRVIRGFLVVAGLWIALTHLTWVILLAFFLGLLVRLIRWGEGNANGREDTPAARRRRRTAVRSPAEDVPLWGHSPAAPRDPDPALGQGEE